MRGLNTFLKILLYMVIYFSPLTEGVVYCIILKNRTVRKDALIRLGDNYEAKRFCRYL